jgi:hypothetical protein
MTSIYKIYNCACWAKYIYGGAMLGYNSYKTANWLAKWGQSFYYFQSAKNDMHAHQTHECLKYKSVCTCKKYFSQESLIKKNIPLESEWEKL